MSILAKDYDKDDSVTCEMSLSSKEQVVSGGKSQGPLVSLRCLLGLISRLEVVYTILIFWAEILGLGWVSLA